MRFPKRKGRKRPFPEGEPPSLPIFNDRARLRPQRVDKEERREMHKEQRRERKRKREKRKHKELGKKKFHAVWKAEGVIVKKSRRCAGNSQSRPGSPQGQAYFASCRRRRRSRRGGAIFYRASVLGQIYGSIGHVQSACFSMHSANVLKKKISKSHLPYRSENPSQGSVPKNLDL